ncbi:MAG: 3-dehydroquinate synthase [Lachnospiraceae bacterium]
MRKFAPESKITVRTAGNEPYDLLLRGSFDALGAALTDLGCSGRRLCIVTDSNVSSYYLDAVKEQIRPVASRLEVYEFEAGESSKTLDVVRGLYEKLITCGFDRQDYLVALGGGVVGDLTGYAAATYLRGIRFVQIPTTLLAQIDSSIGGKTGVDFDQYKNMVGAFHQPSLVYINTEALQTLPEDQFASGMGELLKYGISLDADFYEWTIDHMAEIEEREPEVLAAMITRCCQLKQYIVEKDPTEKGERALLNFGHTIGHAIEKLKDFQLLHGECVALGTVAAAYISWQRGMLDEDEFYEIRDMNVGFGLPISFDGLSSQAVVDATRKDKKMDGGQIRFILLKKLGRAYIATDVTEKEMLEAVDALNAERD